LAEIGALRIVVVTDSHALPPHAGYFGVWSESENEDLLAERATVLEVRGAISTRPSTSGCEGRVEIAFSLRPDTLVSR
jgi:hypothetical protein